MTLFQKRIFIMASMDNENNTTTKWRKLKDLAKALGTSAARATNTSIIAIGNPGAGKSTILNALAGEVLFKSGISFGHGITYQLDERENNRGKFFDTPGLADDTYREVAGKAISTALRKGGNFRILFFVTTQAGRVVRQDITTLKLVLDAVPEIRNLYGIVINKVPEKVAEGLKNIENANMFLTKLFTGIEEGRRCAQTNIAYLMQKSELESKDNKLIALDDLKTLEGSSFEDFIYGQLPSIELTVDAAGDVDTKKFDQLDSVLESIIKKMEQDKKMFMEHQDLLFAQLIKAEQDKDDRQRRDRNMYDEQIIIMQQQLERMDTCGLFINVLKFYFIRYV